VLASPCRSIRPPPASNKSAPRRGPDRSPGPPRPGWRAEGRSHSGQVIGAGMKGSVSGWLNCGGSGCDPSAEVTPSKNGCKDFPWASPAPPPEPLDVGYRCGSHSENQDTISARLKGNAPGPTMPATRRKTPETRRVGPSGAPPGCGHRIQPARPGARGAALYK